MVWRRGRFLPEIGASFAYEEGIARGAISKRENTNGSQENHRKEGSKEGQEARSSEAALARICHEEDRSVRTSRRPKDSKAEGAAAKKAAASPVHVQFKRNDLLGGRFPWKLVPHLHIKRAPPGGQSQRGRNQMAAKETTRKKGLKKSKKLEVTRPLAKKT